MFLLIQPEAWEKLCSLLGCYGKESRRNLKSGQDWRQDKRERGGGGWSSGGGNEDALLEHRADETGSRDKDFEEMDSDSQRNTFSSHDSSMFPLLEEMTEDDLAREIERRYNPHYQSISGLTGPFHDLKAPLVSSQHGKEEWR